MIVYQHLFKQEGFEFHSVDFCCFFGGKVDAPTLVVFYMVNSQKVAILNVFGASWASPNPGSDTESQGNLRVK